MAGLRIPVLLHPLGNTVRVLKPPIEEYRPKVVVLFSNRTDEQMQAKELIENEKDYFATGASEIEHVILKSVSSHDEHTITDLIESIGNAMHEVRKLPEMKGNRPRFIVGTTGGTKLMAIGAAFASMIFELETFYCPDPYEAKTSPRAKPIIELTLLSQLAKASELFTPKNKAKRWVLGTLNKEWNLFKRGLTCQELADRRKTTRQNIQPMLQDLEVLGLLEKSSGRPVLYTLTIPGRITALRASLPSYH